MPSRGWAGNEGRSIGRRGRFGYLGSPEKWGHADTASGISSQTCPSSSGIETIFPHDGAKTMGRYFAKRGPGLYMCYGEAEDVAAIRDRALEQAPADWTGSRGEANPDGLFLHPRALGGVMLGVSRTSVAWRWSGSPGRVRELPR